jgi:hypothetical protein
VRKLVLCFAAAALLGVCASSALAYPKVLGAAINQAYSKKVHLNEICYKHIKTKLYVLAWVEYVKTEKPSTLALRYVEGAGWLAVWKDGNVLPAVPKRLRSQMRAGVKSLRAQCA